MKEVKKHKSLNLEIMKKIIAILVVVGILSLESCTLNEVDQNVDNDTISEVFEVSNISFNDTSNHSVFIDLNPKTYSGDVILVYRLEGYFNGNKVWIPIPESHFYNDGTLFFKYGFSFTQHDVELFLERFDSNTIPDRFRLNQTFRIVIIPAELLYAVDVNNYSDVMKSLNLKESQVQNLIF
jgi:hypothetical protein